MHIIYIVVREMPCMSRSYRTAFTFLPFWATVCLLYLHSVRAQFCWERGKINLPKLLIQNSELPEFLSEKIIITVKVALLIFYKS